MFNKCIALLINISSSEGCVEMIHFFYKGGQHNEMFQVYFDNLLQAMKKKYPHKQLIFVLDNL